MLSILLFIQYYKITTILTLLVLLFYKNTKLNILLNNIIYDNLIYKISILLILLILIQNKIFLYLNFYFYILYIIILITNIIIKDVEPIKYKKINSLKTFLLFFPTYYYNNAFSLNYNIIHIKKTNHFNIKIFLYILFSINFLLINISVLIANILYQSIGDYIDSDKHIVAFPYYIIIHTFDSLNNKISSYNIMFKDKKIYRLWSKVNGNNKLILSNFFKIYNKEVIFQSNIFNFDINNTNQFEINKVLAGKKNNDNIYHYSIITSLINNKNFNYSNQTWFTKLRENKNIEPHEFPISKTTKAGLVLLDKKTIIEKNVQLPDKFKTNQNIVDINDPLIIRQEIQSNNTFTSQQFISEIANKAKLHLEQYKTIKIIDIKHEEIIELDKKKIDLKDEIIILAEQNKTNPELISTILTINNMSNSHFTEKQEIVNDFFNFINNTHIDEKLTILKKNNPEAFNSIIDQINDDDSDIS